ncbi:hypothetical protein [Siminovitchia fordii]|uniref:Uncharacterized protein n=1 Tax=Siminovitchia fordii TaxID=254759 RepID=A0ABQ4K5I5_9BACI|nr:hypothetical protein [Siminovitchia fordii]GIN20997.1 hypothetical protein J1TS3_21310 [Siminovitchia fordii]
MLPKLARFFKSEVSGRWIFQVLERDLKKLAKKLIDMTVKYLEELIIIGRWIR